MLKETNKDLYQKFKQKTKKKTPKSDKLKFNKKYKGRKKEKSFIVSSSKFFNQ